MISLWRNAVLLELIILLSELLLSLYDKNVSPEDFNEKVSSSLNSLYLFKLLSSTPVLVLVYIVIELNISLKEK